MIKINENHEKACKEACYFYNKENTKIGGKSERIVCEKIRRKYNTIIAHITAK